MSETNKFGGRGVVICGALAAASVAAACGNSFSAEDCMVTRTCMASGGAGDAAGAPPDAAGGAAAGAGAGAGGESTGGEAPECVIGPDCSNDDPSDGEELCEKGRCVAGNVPPHVVSVTPTDAAVDVEPDGTIVVEFSEEMDAKTIDAESIQVFFGDEPVLGKVEYSELKASFVPDLRLQLRGEYTVKVSTAAADVDGAHLLEASSSAFTVRDGAWHALDAATGDFSSFSSTLPITAGGDVLLAWAGQASAKCPARAAWFTLSAKTAEPVDFPPQEAASPSCGAPLAASNAAGVAVVAWSEDGPVYTQQFRDQAWLAKSLKVITNSEAPTSALFVAPNGVVSRFDAWEGTNHGLRVWLTDETGVWAQEGTLISPGASPFSAPSIGFDAAGNGLAAWVSITFATGTYRIDWSRFDVESGKWSVAASVPGSVGAGSVARGAPALAVAPSGEALVVWRDGDLDGKLMSNTFAPETGWSAAEVASGKTIVPYIWSRPGLVFDGKSFIAAWNGKTASESTRMYTARYDVESGWVEPEGHDAKKPLPFTEMPYLLSDGRGSSFLFWKTGTIPDLALYYSRSFQDAWSDVQPLPGGAITDDTEDGIYRASVGMTASGVAAIAWGNRSVNRVKSIRLARFY